MHSLDNRISINLNSVNLFINKNYLNNENKKII